MNSKIHFLKVGRSEIFFRKESKINCVFTALSSPGSCSSRLVLVWLLLFSLTVNIPRLLEYQVRLHTTNCCFTVMHYQVQLVRHTTPNTNQAPAHTALCCNGDQTSVKGNTTVGSEGLPCQRRSVWSETPSTPTLVWQTCPATALSPPGNGLR